MPGALSSTLSASAFLGSALVLVPLPWHWRARNIPTLSIIAWLFLCNLTFGINALIWASNVNIVVPVWCDMVTKLKIGATVGLPACVLCLALHLRAIASALDPPKRDRRHVIMDLMLCCGLPVTIMALHYVVQGHRFDIMEDFGCRPAMYISIQSLLLVDLPSVVLSALALICCGLTLFSFFRRRVVFARMVKDTNSPLTTGRFIRLMTMTTVLGTWNALVIGVGMWATYGDGLRPWTSWSDVHSNFSRIQVYPLDSIPNGVLLVMYLLWAAVPISSGLFFGFFAFGEDSAKEYGGWTKWIRRKVFRQRPEPRPKDKDSLDTPSLYAHSLGTLPDGLIYSSWRQPSEMSGPVPSYYFHHSQDSSRRASRATTPTSVINFSPLERTTTSDKFAQAHNAFWAI
ncbi:pheromone A receptor-domain-containing protein [Mycena rosella]|uniref:Pheromone A receptor-domain-containing protein n=1 Tax=Mycena rosella TaxID=1033263 RepID=A0AAD7DIQ0_MYCRO|nr:pheromone A receptor-domain-containing protein [Mycena rosella]